MNDSELTNLFLSILEIISQQRDIHILLVKGQLQEINKVTGKTLEDSDFEQAVHQLEKRGLITEIESRPNSFVLTSKGKSRI